jgi:hypothetical protein
MILFLIRQNLIKKYKKCHLLLKNDLNLCFQYRKDNGKHRGNNNRLINNYYLKIIFQNIIKYEFFENYTQIRKS